jgi:hypothetical protein
MIAEVPLFNDGSPAVAVRTPHLALRDLAFQGRDRALPTRELYDSAAFDTDVVEIQDHRILLSTVDAWRPSQVLEQEEKVAAA